MNHSHRSWPWWRWALTGLSTLALTLSGYLGWHYLMGGEMVGCGVGSPCDHVLNGRWATIGGVVPVSGLAEGAYLAMLMASFYIGHATPEPVRQLAWRAMLVLVGAAAGSAIWFTILQKWVIGSFCPYCMATHFTGLTLAALVIWQAPRQHEDEDSSTASPGGPRAVVAGEKGKSLPVGIDDSRPSKATGGRFITPMAAIGLAVCGLLLSGVMAAAQAIIKPPPAYRGGESQTNLPAIDPHTAPLEGSPDAQYVVTVLFDYQCPHCQKLHFMLDEAIRRYSGKLAFVISPTPLNTRCNSYVPMDVEEFKGSCELAKAGLAVWRAKPEAFAEFNRWMFTFESGDRWHPRGLDATQAKAAELVGQEKFNAALADPWVEQFLQASVRVYGATVQSAADPKRANAVPKLVFGPKWVIPEPNDTDDLLSVLHDSLGIPSPW